MNSFLMRLMRVVALAGAVMGAACSSGAFGDLSPRQLIGSTDKEAEQKALEQFAAVAVCPEIQVREGTQLLRVFEKGKEDDPAAIRFQATIRKFARECHTDPTTHVTTIKIGATGRMLAGPNGATGAVVLPVRFVVVRNGDEVLYSQLAPTEATIGPGMDAVEWTQIVDNVSIPLDKSTGGLVIYVGFDESKPTDKPAKPNGKRG